MPATRKKTQKQEIQIILESKDDDTSSLDPPQTTAVTDTTSGSPGVAEEKQDPPPPYTATSIVTDVDQLIAPSTPAPQTSETTLKKKVPSGQPQPNLGDVLNSMMQQIASLRNVQQKQQNDIQSLLRSLGEIITTDKMNQALDQVLSPLHKMLTDLQSKVDGHSLAFDGVQKNNSVNLTARIEAAVREVRMELDSYKKEVAPRLARAEALAVAVKKGTEPMAGQQPRANWRRSL